MTGAQFFWTCFVSFIGGYIASVYTWDKFHTWIVGEKAKIDALRLKIKGLEASIRAKL